MRLLVVLFWLAASRMAIAAEPFAQVTVDGDGQIVPGQQVHVTVDVFVPDFFTSPPQFPLFNVANALVTLPDERAQNLIQTVDGVQYSGISRHYVVVPETAGTFTLPEIAIELGYSQDGRPTKATARAPSTSFQVVATADGAATAPVFAARALTLTQSFDRDPSTLKAGDALVRTITVFANDTQAMMIPPVGVGTAPGLRQYEKPPKVEDGVATDRGAGSRRIQVVVYTAQTPGSFDIPSLSYPWFDAGDHARKLATLSAVKVVVAAAAATQQAITPELEDDQNGLLRILARLIVAGAAIIVLLAIFFRPARRMAFRVANWISESDERRRHSPRYQLGQLRRTIRTADPAAIYAGLQAWSAKLGHRTLADWLSSENSPELSRQVAILAEGLFRGKTAVEVDRKRLASLVGIRGSSTTSATKPVLPDLNPV
ncbi:BatD family protein [Rhizobium mayense]|uniref:BatD family protein n=1 Tax=Rhizobium mayense TaxID=1312184 RepID=A0ABT7K3Y6_9HYPH|nr:BatD family protein [Rhizobium mayense]MDL2402678.1 BatD family protein [Rhizobium mayense]